MIDLVPREMALPRNLSVFPVPWRPFQACGAMVMDGRGMLIANCPNSQLADLVAYGLNVQQVVHPDTGL